MIALQHLLNHAHYREDLNCRKWRREQRHEKKKEIRLTAEQ